MKGFLKEEEPEEWRRHVLSSCLKERQYPKILVVGVRLEK